MRVDFGLLETCAEEHLVREKLLMAHLIYEQIDL